jgi:hypothetical protein
VVLDSAGKMAMARGCWLAFVGWELGFSGGKMGDVQLRVSGSGWERGEVVRWR